MRNDDHKFITKYLNILDDITTHSNYREESLYPYLKDLIENIANDRKIQVIQSPGKTNAGYPDFLVKHSNGNIIGYIEAKKPGENLDKNSYQQQIERYKNVFANFLYTDFITFRLYKKGILIKEVSICKGNEESYKNFLDLIDTFLDFKITIYSKPKELARKLASIASFFRDYVILENLKQQIDDKENNRGILLSYYETFKYLLNDLTPEFFSDIFVQMITHSLFISRVYSNSDIDYKEFYKNIPKYMPIIKDSLKILSIEDKHDAKLINLMIENIVNILNAVDWEKFLKEYKNDHVLHFYETFLAYYDKKQRKRRGNYYTPNPAVKYIVESVDKGLKLYLNKSDGLSDPTVSFLDPSAGTMTFFGYAIKLAIDNNIDKYGEGSKIAFIKSHILKNFYAFEVLMAPYIMGHYHMISLLESYGYNMNDSERFNLYLTNTLENENIEQVNLFIVEQISKEHKEANKIKSKNNFTVIMGNPPYLGNSNTFSEWIVDMLKKDYDGAPSYYSFDGESIEFKNKRFIQDDYVKFIRFAQTKINENGCGIMAYICNHSFIDNITFSGMRRSLLCTFDDIYVINLHGNSRREDGKQKSKSDENIFNIKQGVSILICIKHYKPRDEKRVYYYELYGTKEEKLDWLNNHDITNTPFQVIKPVAPLYLFRPVDIQESNVKYESYVKVDQLFIKYTSGLMSGRDHFALSENKDILIERLYDLSDIKNKSNDFILKKYNLEKDEKIESKLDKIRMELSKVEKLEDLIKPICYRPLDTRYIIYYKDIVNGGIENTVRNMLLTDNIALCIGRQGQAVGDDEWNVVFCTDKIADLNLFRRGGVLIFPLYLKSEMSIFSDLDVNINLKYLKALEYEYKTDVTPTQIFSYVYAVLQSNKYRSNYKDYLMCDLPRIPFPKDYNIFKKMCKIGEELIMLHLMRKDVDNPIIKYEGDGEDVINKIFYDKEKSRLYINDTQYFDGITLEMWNYKIGGYKVLEKWIKDRKGKVLSLSDIKHYINMCFVIYNTIEIRKNIDNFYNKVEEDYIPL
ncbi:MAG: type ISP restriction/modification enzyme [Candidatus Aenigmatarchaeota archaeon]